MNNKVHNKRGVYTVLVPDFNDDKLKDNISSTKRAMIMTIFEHYSDFTKRRKIMTLAQVLY